MENCLTPLAESLKLAFFIIVPNLQSNNLIFESDKIITINLFGFQYSYVRRV